HGGGNPGLRRPHRGYSGTRPADRKTLVALPDQRNQQGLPNDLHGRREAVHSARRRSKYHSLRVTIGKREEVSRAGVARHAHPESQGTHPAGRYSAPHAIASTP